MLLEFYKELAEDVQSKVEALWGQITDDNLSEISDMEGYKKEFLRLFGFEIDGVDYEADISPLVPIENMVV